jgi:murein DD-endopeptidase MepM/ murein hydrolase activator NlpD
VAGQFLADGTLLKPVVVDTTVEDGRSQLRTYKVRSGDTLTGIASRTGVSMMTIWWANKLTSKDDLKIGQVLVIPPVDGLVVTVKAGDTLASIAEAKHVEAAEIVAINALTDETLVIGQVLILPGARGKAIPTPRPTKRPVVRVATVSRPSTTTRTTTRPPVRYTGGAFAWPVAGGYISQYFHYGHPALDIAADYGTGVKAAAAGTVTFAGWKSNGGGYQVWIAHGSGLYTTYNHMSSVAVSTGARVGRGMFIGRIGTSGWATGPHLHFEIWRGPIWSGGYRVNPLAYL